MRLKRPSDLAKARKLIQSRYDPKKTCVTVCCGTGCVASAARDVAETFRKEIDNRGLRSRVNLRITGCHGFCEKGPLIVIYPKRIFYQRVKVEDVKEVISQTVLKGKIIERLLYIDPATGKKIICEGDIPFYKKQKRLIFGNNGRIDPTKIGYYIAMDGYTALAKVLYKMSPQQVIDEIKKSGLRGRGGAGFPTGAKWELCRQQKERLRYIICNADEGDPGAFMDRSLLEGNPHSVLEGMIIGAYAIGTEEGYIYVRNEYPLAIKHLQIALKQAQEWGLLGRNILGTDFNFRIKINRGAGAFVCGEESALMASIEGRIGEPQPRPPFPAESGLWGKPTNINNVKTWANVPLIINRGASWYSKIGTKTSKGTMVFSLVGKINNTGLVEVPMGISLRKMVYEIGGGIPNGKKFKAVQTGGPSGGCIPARLINLPVDYEKLTEAGSMMGSGGMVVMDEDTCMVNVAKYFLSFTRDESCGKCTPCREGIKQMYEILNNITKGKGKESDLKLLKELAEIVKDSSLCGLGQTAPNPVLTTLKYFRGEYSAHIRDKRCPAKVCPDLIRYSVIKENCVGCQVCNKVCPTKAISGKKKVPQKIDQKKCIKCGACYEVCKFEAIGVE